MTKRKRKNLWKNLWKRIVYDWTKIAQLMMIIDLE
jgi:hypothetical protein